MKILYIFTKLTKKQNQPTPDGRRKVPICQQKTLFMAAKTTKLIDMSVTAMTSDDIF